MMRLRIKLMRLRLIVKDWWRWQRVKLCRLLPMNVLLDQTDGTVSLDKGLMTAVSAARKCDADLLQVYMFKVASGRRLPCGSDYYYCFTLNPSGLKGVESHKYELQVCQETLSIGFAPTCPTVALMMHDYGYGWKAKIRLEVVVEHVAGMIIFRILPESK